MLINWIGSEIAIHIHLFILVIYALYNFITFQETRTLTNELLFMIALGISLLVHNDIKFRRSIKHHIEKIAYNKN